MTPETHKALVVGGGSGIGLSVVAELISHDYYVYIVDRNEPDQKWLPNPEKWRFIKSDLRYLDENLFQRFSEDRGIALLMITAGFGRVAEFKNIGISEIDGLMTVNAASVIKLLRIFYERICDQNPFYCGVMGSIAGWVSSPLFSVYAASKAALCRFVESLNIELEEGGCENRCLNVSPGSIRGTRFNGGDNDLSLTDGLAKEIIEKLFSRETLYIPEYETVYKGVISKYRDNPHDFGLESYRYKLASGRVKSGKREILGYLSGTFDLFHIGHLNLLRRAKEKCDYLIAGVHPSGSWKGKETFIPLQERMEILSACRYVDKVVIAPDEDDDAWKQYRFQRLFVGSDYQGTERFQRYEEYFSDKNVKIIYFPYTKGTSSTQLRAALHAEEAVNGEPI